MKIYHLKNILIWLDRDLLNKHKPIEELNDNNNKNNNNNNNNNNSNNNDTDRAEWKIQLSIIISCISTRSFKDKRTMHSKSEPEKLIWAVIK